VSARAAPGAASRPLVAVLTVFLPFAGGYFLSYLYRTVNSVIAPQLVADLGLSAADLGLLTAAYFFSFAAFQLPLGLLLDRYGPRRVQACLLLVAALGAVLFALGPSKELLMAGRALIGLGVAGGLMASFKAITLWFPKERWPLVNGCFVAMGGLGAMTATAPVELALGFTDWRGIFLGLGAVTLLAASVIFLVVPERPRDGPVLGVADLVAGLRRVYGAPLFWRIAPLGFLAAAAGMSIQSLWAGPWLRDVAGLDRAGVAGGLLLIATALTLGAALTGLVTDLLGRRGVDPLLVMGGGGGLFLLALGILTLQMLPGALWPWLLFALAGNSVMLGYPILCRHFPLDHAGRVNAGINVLVFGFAFLSQYGIGAIIDLWPVDPNGAYALEGYRAGFGLVFLLVLLAYIWFLAGLLRLMWR